MEMQHRAFRVPGGSRLYLQPYNPEQYRCHLISEAKQVWAWLVLGYETAWEYRVLSSFCLPLGVGWLLSATLCEESRWNQDCFRTNINNFRYTCDTTLMAESEELKSLLMKVKEESEKVGLKLHIQHTKIRASGPITSWQIDGETVADFIFLGSRITADGDCSHEIKRHLLL